MRLAAALLAVVLSGPIEGPPAETDPPGWRWYPPHLANGRVWPAGWYRWDGDEMKWGLLGFGWHQGWEPPIDLDDAPR